MNKLILFLSQKNVNAQKCEYNSDYGKFTGTISADAPTKYFLKSVPNLDEIICMTTDKSNVEEYQSMISNFCDSNNIRSPKIKKITYSDNSSQTIKYITENLKKGDNVYIDTTGGFRDVVYIFLFIVRFLEYAGINFKKAIYANYKDLSITDVTSIYKLFNLINSVDNFTSFGNSRALSNIFTSTENKYIKNLIKSMNDFSDAMALCRTKNIDKIFNELNTNLNALEDNLNINDSYELLFSQMTDLIRQKFHLDSNSIDYVSIIKWCLDNNLLQQAITIYTDKIPRYLHENGYFEYSNSVLKQDKVKNSKNDIDYEIFYNDFLQMKLEGTYLENTNIPLKSLLNNNDVFLALRNSRYLEDFKKSKCISHLKLDYSIPEINNGITNILRLKRSMYIGDTRNSQENIEKNLESTPVLLQISKNITANSFKGMIENLKNNEKSLIMLQQNLKKMEISIEDTNNIKSNERFNVVEHLEEFLKGNPQFSVRKIDNFKSIIRDYLYIKNWLRNQINHASDEASISDLNKQYYQDHGYSISEDFSVMEINSVIQNALNKLNI